ncbi:uncharacterized protein LOC122524217 [Polistes fuscatus]|uniref:uncharacterized protein LOC122524217 n=1 Tax=Polistes fuscatus TaxID=30207 RepID=UPI001CA95F71|nr:uncharacterized protein LOC122524217 [Polistes fuscatus]
MNCRQRAGNEIDESIFEEICEIIFDLIPQAPQLKQLFLNWSELNDRERTRLDVKSLLWCCPKRRNLYKSLREAMIRWENIQETEGAPGCEPSTIPSRYSHLEEELGNLVFNMEICLLKRSENMYDRVVDKRTTTNSSPPSSNINCKRNSFTLLSNCKDYCRVITNQKTSSLRSVHSWCCSVDSKSSEDELSGYLTN